jgi:hypothetical protein
MKLLVIAATLFLSAAGFAQSSPVPSIPTLSTNDPLQSELLSVANATWTAVEQQNMAAMQTLTSHDFTFVGAAGIVSGPELGSALQSCKLSSFKLTSPQLRKLSSKAAVLVYKVEQESQCNGKPDSPQLFVTDSFIRNKGKWVIVVHTETPAATAAQ